MLKQNGCTKSWVPFVMLFCYFSFKLQNQKRLEGIFEKIVIEKATLDPSQVSEGFVAFDSLLDVGNNMGSDSDPSTQIEL